MAERSKQLTIFYLFRTDDAEYGDFTAHVIIADSEQQARLIAGRACRHNGIVWVDPECTQCRALGTTKMVEESSIVMSQTLSE